jgi:hypothetical protein
MTRTEAKAARAVREEMDRLAHLEVKEVAAETVRTVNVSTGAPATVRMVAPAAWAVGAESLVRVVKAGWVVWPLISL